MGRKGEKEPLEKRGKSPWSLGKGTEGKKTPGKGEKNPGSLGKGENPLELRRKMGKRAFGAWEKGEREPHRVYLPDLVLRTPRGHAEGAGREQRDFPAGFCHRKPLSRPRELRGFSGSAGEKFKQRKFLFPV